MMIRRFGGTHPLGRLRDEMDRLLNEFTTTDWPSIAPFSLMGWRTFPALNVWEDDHNVYAEAEVPGMSMDDLEVLVMGNELTIKGERAEQSREGVSYHRRERGAGTFSRVLRLPIDVNADKVTAALKDGVLTITLPKTEVARPRKIKVKTISE